MPKKTRDVLATSLPSARDVATKPAEPRLTIPNDSDLLTMYLPPETYADPVRTITARHAKVGDAIKAGNEHVPSKDYHDDVAVLLGALNCALESRYVADHTPTLTEAHDDEVDSLLFPKGVTHLDVREVACRVSAEMGDDRHKWPVSGDDMQLLVDVAYNVANIPTGASLADVLGASDPAADALADIASITEEIEDQLTAASDILRTIGNRTGKIDRRVARIRKAKKKADRK